MVKEFTKHSKEALSRKSADVVKHGNGPVQPQEPYQIDVSRSIFPRYEDDAASCFLAANGKNRPQPHVKINDCDY